MKYTVEVLIRNLETGAVNIVQRTVSLEREKSSVYPHDPLPVDSDQKDRLLHWALNETSNQAVKERDKISYHPERFKRDVGGEPK